MDYAKENSLESTGVYYDYYLNNPADTQCLIPQVTVVSICFIFIMNQVKIFLVDI